MMHNNYGLILLKKGRAARASGDPQEAVRLFQRAEEQVRISRLYEPGREGMFRNLFSVLVEQGKDEQAIGELSWLLTGRQQMPEAQRKYYQQLYTLLGTLLLATIRILRHLSAARGGVSES